MTRTRLRTDSAHLADDAARVDRGVEPLWHNADDPELLAMHVAMPGDTWRVRWHKEGGEGPIAGYAICCPKCREVHWWTGALNCGTRKSDGVCAHSGVASCWEWTGSAEAGTLTASPSLHCLSDRGGCGWHGWLKDGVLTSC